MFGKSQTGAGHGQCSPSFPRCYMLLPEGQEREGVSSLGQMGKCLCTYSKACEVKSKKEPGAGPCGIPGYFQNPDSRILKNLNPGFFRVSRSLETTLF